MSSGLVIVGKGVGVNLDDFFVGRYDSWLMLLKSILES